MRFNVTLIDPPGFRCAHFLYDLSRYLAYSLESLGHDCTIQRNRCEKGALNILVGTHHLARWVEVQEILGSAREWVVFQTEIVRNSRINDQDDPRWREVVLPLLKGARAVWESLRANVRDLEQHDVHAEFIRFGYHPAMQEIRYKNTRDIDFLFYGSVTPRRGVILEKLASLGYQVRVEFDAPWIYRNDLIARSEIVLTLRQSETMNHLPQGRIIYLVNNGALVAGEGGLEQDGLEDVFAWTNADVVEHCRALRANPDIRRRASEFYETFRSRPMVEFVRPLVESLAK